ncbi:MAG: stage III sporulation protein AE [Bacteroides sp.]|nr:stage III sporulation protein AE [Bacteroides sp.]
MKIKGFLKAILFAAVFMLLQNKVYAEDISFGRYEIEGALPEAAAEEMERLNIFPDSEISETDAEGIFSWISSTIAEGIPKPLTMLVSTAAVIILCALISAMQEGSELSGTFNTVGVLACSGILCTSLVSLSESAKLAVDGFAAFLSVYIPAFAGIMAANGQTETGAAYSAVVTVAVQVLSQIFALVIFPLTSCIMGISIAGAVDPELKISSIADMTKKLVNWGLTLIMTVFAGLLSVQSFVSAAADTVSMKAVKFTVAGAVPIVGGAVSDALSTVKGSLGLIKAATGGYGIIASAVIMVPILISAMLFRIALMAAASLSDALGTSRLTVLLKSGESAASVIIAVIVCFWLTAVVSTAIMLVIGTGA